jgi:glycosyltransferase involved in cell wall biosynthesis
MAGYREDVAAALSAADVLLHPTHADALPSALMEAMAAGVPVIATAVGGIPEIVADGITGMLVPAPPDPAAVAGALEPLVADAALRARLGAAGRVRYGQQFTAEAWARRLRAVYDEILVA